MNEYFYDIINSYRLKKSYNKFEVYEPFYRELKIGDKGIDVWRLKYLYSRYLYYHYQGTDYIINEEFDEPFYNSINRFKKEYNINESNIGIETMKLILEKTHENFYFFVEVELPDNRSKLGKFKLYNNNGDLEFSCDARGNGQHDVETIKSQAMENGDTPIGIYIASYESGILKNNIRDYGPAGVFRLWYPLYGYATKIYKVNRDGILIHGGTEDENLRRSHGCVVMHNDNISKVQKIMIDKIKHPYHMPTKYVEHYTGVVFIKRLINE